MIESKDNDDMLSIDFDDDNKDYEKLDKFLKNQTSRVFNKDLDNIFENGEKLLNEIENKNKRLDAEKGDMISYILSKTKKYSKSELKEYDYYDVLDIFNETKHKNRSIFKKILDLI